MNISNAFWTTTFEMMEENLINSERLRSTQVIIIVFLWTIEINKTSFGSSIVRIGDTIVMCLLEGTLARKNLGKITYVSTSKSQDQYIGKDYYL
jgi:hypothetical protein